MYVNADEWNNPVEYYNKYGNNAVFKADGKTKGEIYFCSVGNTSNSGTKYKTLGYKMSVKDENGNILQNVCPLFHVVAPSFTYRSARIYRKKS